MTELSEIEFGRLDIRDGDVLVLKVRDMLSRQQREHLMADVWGGLGERFEHCKVVILAGGIDIAVLRKEAVVA